MNNKIFVSSNLGSTNFGLKLEKSTNFFGPKLAEMKILLFKVGIGNKLFDNFFSLIIEKKIVYLVILLSKVRFCDFSQQDVLRNFSKLAFPILQTM